LEEKNLLSNMYLSSMGVFLSLILLFSFTALPEVYGQEKLVTAKSVGFEETTIIEFHNSEDSKNKIDTIRLWLGSNENFKSFKTEQGWTGQKTPQGVIIFKATTPVEPGEIVKFGVKTDRPKPGINWKALYDSDKQIETGKTLVSESTSIEPKVKTTEKGLGVFENSSFRLVPEKPNVGSSMRVTGDKFAANHELDFYIGTKKIETFETDGDGHFMFTSSVPKNLKADRVDFKIIDSEGNEKTISLRIGEGEDRMASAENIPLTISATPPIVYRGDLVNVSGTGLPGSTVTATIRDEIGNVLTTIAVDVGLDGNWQYQTLIPIDEPFGKHTAEITDGTTNLLRSWMVESSKVIEIIPVKLKYEPGDTIVFNGTAKPSQEIELILEDPQGNEFFSEILGVDATGYVYLEIPTIASSPDGTYVLFASQGEDTDIVLVGLGELPEEKLVAKPDKLNYATGEKLILDIQGPPSSTISLLIVDPSDKDKFSDTVILGPDGQSTYELDLTGYSSGVYTAVITRGNSQTSDVFSVGLITGSGEINVRTTKDSYKPGESILVLGDSSKNILMTLELLDNNGIIIKSKETFTNKDGVFSESSFRIPSDAKPGKWTIHARSGQNFDDAEITVVGNIAEGMVILVDSILPSPGGDLVTISGYGAAVSQQVIITIFDEDGVEITELSIFSTGTGEFSTIWLVSNDIPPGTYTLKAVDAFDESETTVVIE
jgi:hypothetical protein